jgi:SNF2 family DNA or RNA helicase
MLRRTKKEVGVECGDLDVTKCDVDWKAENEMILSKKIHSYLSINKNLREAFVSSSSSKTLEKEVSLLKVSPFDNKMQLELYIRAKQSCILPNLIGKRLLGKDLWKSNYTSKIDAVVDCVLSKRMNGNGKLIFCTYRYEMDTIFTKLASNNDNGLDFDIGFDKEKILIFDGRLTNAARKKCLSNLSIYSVIIIQIQTGCEGLNLQDYFNEVYFVSPNWNPCIEDQAIARCHRIGQQKKVFVYKFEMINDLVSDKFMSLISDFIPLDVKKIICDYVPICNMKWINMDEYIVSVQGAKREIIREFIY